MEYPSHHPNSKGIFPNKKPSSYWGAPMAMEPPTGQPSAVLVHFGTAQALLLGQQHLRLRQEVKRLHLAPQQPGTGGVVGKVFNWKPSMKSMEICPFKIFNL